MCESLLMNIRKYRPADLPLLAALFYDTVHSICAEHYSMAELDAWAPAQRDLSPWAHSLAANYTLVAERDGCIVGFADADISSSYLDHLYIHKDYQRRGIATALCTELEAAAQAAGAAFLYTHASITARSFFLRRGYTLLRPNQAPCGGCLLTNYVMRLMLAGDLQA